MRTAHAYAVRDNFSFLTVNYVKSDKSMIIL